MIFAATTPPAVHAPAKPCADYTPVNLHVLRTTIATSPDCRWAVVVVGSDDIEAGQNNRIPFKLPRLIEETENAFVIERATNRIIYRFEMVRSASLHWLQDDRHLVINYFAGSGSNVPLLFTLASAPLHRPVNLSVALEPDILRRARADIPKRKAKSSYLYHSYVDYVEDAGSDITISAEITLAWQEGGSLSGLDKCYIYHVNKVTRRYRFIREGGDHACPGNPDEKWN